MSDRKSLDSVFVFSPFMLQGKCIDKCDKFLDFQNVAGDFWLIYNSDPGTKVDLKHQIPGSKSTCETN